MDLRSYYRGQLKGLTSNVVSMGKAVAQRINSTIYALREMDSDTAKDVFESDSEIDDMEQWIENSCIKIISLQKPFASDLRVVSSILKIITDIERIADQCADICEMVMERMMSKTTLCVISVVEMMERVESMFLRTCALIENFDVEEAFAVCSFDDEIDAKFSDIILKVCEVISTQNFSRAESEGSGLMKIRSEVNLIFIAKYVERIGDHCTNIAEWIIYAQTGEHKDLN
ncbi:MAG: phosphate signaling complex protein PhoU [Oscillospiraceae bacterium]|jgi:phosphate transport system protein|nr:phosphate signaling complex protein PhoU [Oscillospiraceae bacterium]